MKRMKDFSGIAIGINQYKFLEPLSYAQQDAEALYTLLIKEVGLTPEKCWLLNDRSPPQEGQPTYPSRGNILNAVKSLCQKQRGDGEGLWFFFRGYGFSYKGEDYLMPIEGLMSEVEATGISVRTLMNELKEARTKRVLLLLDISRDRDRSLDERIGINTIELARELEFHAVLSCQPNQITRETSALRQGFFTAALLEGLRSGDCTTLKSLDNFLSYRLPELCDRHLRPRQDPLVVANPPEEIDTVIFPQGDRIVNKSTLLGLNNSQLSQSATVDGQQGKDDLRFQINNVPSLGKQTMSPNTTQQIKSDKSFIQKLILTSGAVALVLLVGVFTTNKSVFLGQETEGGNFTTEPDTGPMPAISSSDNLDLSVPSPIVSSSIKRPGANLSTDSQILLDEARTSLRQISASHFSEAIAKASEIQRNDPLYPEAQLDIERWSLNILDIADGRALQGDYTNAIAAARLVPDFVPIISQQAQIAISQWEPLAQQLQANTALLTAAKALIEPGQASSYNKAIDKAREVVPNMPGYEEAQKLIANWSDTIFNIAQLRAKRENYSEAIRAAELVPSATPAYELAQKAIADWKIQQRNKEES